MTPEQKLEFIKRNTQEIVTEEELHDLLKTKKQPVAYVGYAPTGLLHVGHLVPLVKISDFLRAGFKFIFLSADLHAYLDDQKTPWELLDARSQIYTGLVKSALKSMGTNPSNIEFVKGSDFQLKKEYFLDVLRLIGLVTFNRARRAAAEVVRFGEQPKVGGFVYPLMQNCDVSALNTDVAFGGIDQRGIYMLGREVLPEIGLKKPICVFMPLISSLAGARMGGKMSASVEKSKISLLDSEQQVNSKTKEAFCPAREKEGNGILELLQYALFPILEIKKQKFLIERAEKYGGNIAYASYLELEKDFLKGKIHPADLKQTVAGILNQVLEPIRKDFASHKNKELLKKAYPQKL